MSAFRLTEQYSNELLGLSGLPLLQAVEAIVNKHRTKPPRWIPVTERMPTIKDGMKGSTWPGDKRLVFWMTPDIGCVWGSWNDPPPGAIAWCRIPNYGNPVPTPEDKERLAFEKWAAIELDGCTERYPEGQYTYEGARCAWAAWQAARADAGKPELVLPSQEDIDWEEFRAWVASNLWTHYRYIERSGNMFAAFRAGKAKGGQQP